MAGDTIHRGVIEVAVDGSGVTAGIEQAKASLKGLEGAASAAGAKLGAALDDPFKGINLDATTKRMVNSLQREAEQANRTKAEIYELKLARADALSPGVLAAGEKYIQQLRESEAAQKKVAIAAREEAQAQRDAARVKSGNDQFLRGLQSRAFSVGKLPSEIAEFEAAQRGLTASAAPMIAALRASETRFNQFGLTAKQTAAAIRQVPSQFTDIFISLQGGQNPLTVLLQQGGQLKDVFGGVGPAAQALGRYVLGLINPFTLAAAAAAGVGLAYKAAADESDAFGIALIKTNNVSGTTISQLNGMAEAIDNIVGTQSAAAEGLAAFASTGQVAGKDLQQFTVTALRLKEVAGVAVADTVKQFAELGRSPVEASLKLNQTMRYLTLGVYDQIKALEEQGRASEAGAVSQQAYDRALSDGIAQMQERLGPFQQAWIDLKNVINEAGDAIVGIFRKGSIDTQIAALQKRVQAARNPANLGLFEGRAKEDEQQILILQRQQYAAEQAAESDRTRILNADAAVKASTKIDAANKRALTDQEKINAELKEYRAQLDILRTQPTTDAVKARLDPAQIAKTEAAIKAGPKRAGRSSPVELDTGKSGLEAQLADSKRILDSLTGAYRNAESILEAVRSAGLVSEGEYYDAKRKFIADNALAVANAAIDQEAALELEAERLQAKAAKLKGNDAVRVEREIIDINRKIADSEEKRALATANAATQTELLNIRQAASLASLTRSYEEARIAAEQYLNSLTLQQDREVAALGTGRRGRDQAAGRNQITDRYQGQREQLEAGKRLLEFEGKFTEEARAQYDTRLAIINEYNARALASFDAYYARRLEKEYAFNTGASDALNDYLDSVKNVAAETERLFGKAFSGLEDALLDFTKTGKLNFKSLAQSITDDLNRTIIRQNITGPLAEWLQGGLKTGEGASGSITDGLRVLMGGKQSQGGPDVAQQGLLSLKTLGIDPATEALMRFTQAANSAQFGGRPSTSANQDAFSLDGAFTSDGAAKSLFEKPADEFGSTLVDARSSTQMFSDILGPASVAVAQMAKSGSAAGASLQLLPLIIQAMQGSGGGGGGGGFGSLIVSGISSLFGGGGFASFDTSVAGNTGGITSDTILPSSLRGGRAGGGPVEAGSAYMTGEFGRELFVPRTSGTVIPAAQTEKLMRGGNGGTVNQHFYVTGAVDKRTQGQVFSEAARGATMARVRGTA